MFSIFETGFSDAATIDSVRPKQSDAERLLRDLEAHRDSQKALLASTKRALSYAKTPLAGYALGLIETNQLKQLRTLDRMIASLEDALYWRFSPDALPSLANVTERRETLAAIDELLVKEQEQAKASKRLAKAYGPGLEQALLDASVAISENDQRYAKLLLSTLEEQQLEAPTTTSSWQAVLADRRASAANTAEERELVA